MNIFLLNIAFVLFIVLLARIAGRRLRERGPLADYSRSIARSDDRKWMNLQQDRRQASITAAELEARSYDRG